VSGIVTVDISRIVAPRPQIQYATLFNATPKEMIAFSRKHDKCYVFNFVDLPIDENLPNFSRLRRSKCAEWLVQPFYVGNISQEDRQTVIDKICGYLSMDGMFELVNIAPGIKADGT